MDAHKCFECGADLVTLCPACNETPTIDEAHAARETCVSITVFCDGRAAIDWLNVGLVVWSFAGLGLILSVTAFRK
jgi:hypothetical protein